MATTSVYFIPQTKFTTGQFKTAVEKTLGELHMIDGYYDEEDESYAPGELLSFEYATIHDTDKDRLIPEASSEGYGATCTNCKADIDDEFYDSLNDFYDFEGEHMVEKDMKSISATCQKCKKVSKLTDISFKQPTAIANQYFQFVDLNSEIENGLIQKIESLLKCPLTIIYESM
jgi:ribosomal protein S24E